MASESQNSGVPTGKLVITMRLEDDTNETIFQAEKTSFFNGQPSATLYRAMDTVLHDCGADIVDKLNLVYPTCHRDVTDGAPTPSPSGPSQSTNTPNTTTLGKRRRSDIPLPSIEDPAEFEQPKRARTGSVDRADSMPNNGGGDDDDDEDYNEQPSPEYSPCYRPPQTPEMEAEPAAHSDEQDEENEYQSRISGTLEPNGLPGPDPSPCYRPHPPDMEPQPAAHSDERQFAPAEEQHPVRAANNDGYHWDANLNRVWAGSWHVAPDQARIPTAAAGTVVPDVDGNVVDDDGWNSSDTLIDDDIDDEEEDDDYEENEEDEEYEEDEEEDDDDDDEVDLFIGATPYAAGLPVDYLAQETREQRNALEV